MASHSPQAEAVLNAIGAGCTYGVAIMRRTGLKSGTVYPILKRLLTAGLVSEKGSMPSPEPGRPARRLYELKPPEPTAG